MIVLEKSCTRLHDCLLAATLMVVVQRILGLIQPGRASLVEHAATSCRSGTEHRNVYLTVRQYHLSLFVWGSSDCTAVCMELSVAGTIISQACAQIPVFDFRHQVLNRGRNNDAVWAQYASGSHSLSVLVWMYKDVCSFDCLPRVPGINWLRQCGRASSTTALARPVVSQNCCASS